MSRRTPLVLSTLAGLAALAGLLAWWLLSSRGASPEVARTTSSSGGEATSPSRPADPRTPLGASSPVDEKVTLTPEVAQGLLGVSRKAWTAVPLRDDDRARSRSRMRAVAGRMLDLDRAHARKSTRFNRTSYTQDVTTDDPIHLADRFGPDGKPTTRGEARPGVEPVRVVYREGDDGTTFDLVKMKEQASPSGGLDPAVASEQAKRFLADNGLLAETAIDRIETNEVRERRVSAEAPGGGDQDLLAQQDVLLRRTYDGKQVINSRASVGVLPGSGEVVQVKVERWTPVDPAGASTTKAELPEEEARRLATGLEDKLRRQIALQAEEPIASAHVEHVEEAWFQTDTGLIPVLVFVVQVTFVQDPNEARTLIVAINPNGDDALIWDQGRIVRGPSAEPTDPM